MEHTREIDKVKVWDAATTKMESPLMLHES